ncbi:MAG TPA: alanine racemase [Candidatus Limnocylindria bacterium]|nr:alanine racemase [Candidatus Limnocylindria bacterium]
MSAPPAAPSIEDRLAAAGLPALPRTAWAEIDLGALASNLAVIRELAGPGVAVHPVVKANAYGHGAIEVARALAAAGADGFCVAAMDEALALREAGIELPILVLYPIPLGLVAAARQRLITVAVGDRQLLAELIAAVARDPHEKPLQVQMELETGLGRGGFVTGDALAAAAELRDAHGVRLVGTWTHLQAPEDESLTRGQATAFDGTTHELESRVGPAGTRHLAASGGLLLGEAGGLDAVRPGLAMYGLLPDELLGQGLAGASKPRALATPARGLRPILSLHARPVRVAELPTGSGISYGPTFTTARPSRIATLPLGYGDGWPRSLSNRAEALVRGRRVPLVGNVAMDAVMADVTDVPGPPVTVADEFVLLGEQGSERITAADLAATRGTNSWEVVTNLSARLPRVYHAASVPQALRTLVSGDAHRG